MNTHVKFVVCGSDLGYGEWDHRGFDTLEDAQEYAEGWAKYEDMVWVEKRTTFSHILWSSSTSLPRKELIPL